MKRDAGSSVVFALASVVLAAGVCPAASGEDRPDVAPGPHKRLPCESKPEWTYDLYIPGAYARDKEKKFPVLFLSGPGGNPGFMQHEGWAERNGLIVACINDSKNGIDPSVGAQMQDAVIESVEKDLRLHPCLRFSMGFSGAAWASTRLANRHADKHAGVVLLAHSGNGSDRGLAKHVAVAFIHGEEDNVHPVSASRSVCKSLKSRGNPTRIITGPWGHNVSTKENREAMLTWMLDLMRLTHPGLSPAEVKAGAAEIERRAKGLAGIAEARSRLSEVERMLGLPKRLWLRHARLLHDGWFSAAYELASGVEDPIDRHEALTVMSEDERIRSCSSSDKKKLLGDLRKLRREGPVRKEWKARQIYAQIAAMEKKLPDRPAKSRKMQVVNSYVALARKYARTVYGKKAAEAAKRLAGE